MEALRRRFTKSRAIYRTASKIIPGGVHSNFRFFRPHPVYFAKASGCRIWDVDGNEYIDCVMNNGALILGHKDPRVTRAVRNQIQTGLTAAVESELSYLVAKKLHEMVPTAEMVRFSTTGTEAVMHAVMLARAYTKKNKIAKIEGGYNGWYDQVAISEHPPLAQAGPRDSPRSVVSSEGLLDGVERQTYVIPFNDEFAAERILRRNKREVAALLIEPVAFNMGAVLPKRNYLKAIREITEENDVLLIFDEVISGFRLAPGGAQEYYGVEPDLSVFAKAIANGFPLSAIVGIEEVMRLTTPDVGSVAYAGTYNGHQISLAAASVTLDPLQDGSIQRRLNLSTSWMIKRFTEFVEDIGLEARLQGIGGQFQIYFTGSKVTEYRVASTSNPALFRRFRENMLAAGVYLLPFVLFHHGISAAHSQRELDHTMEAAQRSLAVLKAEVRRQSS